MGVASTTKDDTLSSFSNYGEDLVWVAAPGEGIITTYPFGTYAAGWGTSFSAPLVSGTAALLVSQATVTTPLNLLSLSSRPQVATALSHTQPIPDPKMGYGRLDTYLATQAWRKSLG